MLTITSIGNLTCICELHQGSSKFLIDIDIDFFMNPYSDRVYSYVDSSSYWIKSEMLYQKLKPYLLRTEIITIARSINGSFTPLLYSYISEFLYDMFLSKNTYNYEIMEYAMELFDCGNYIDAIHNFKKIFSVLGCCLSARIGALYSYLSIGDFDSAKKEYEYVSANIREYDAYIFPITNMIKNNKYTKAVEMIEYWISMSKKSEYANLYAVKYSLVSSDVVDNTHIDRVTDEGTKFEKSYVLSEYYLKVSQYDNAIDCCEKVLHFLRTNKTPIWAGHISSFEYHKNHGIVMAYICERLSTAYYKTNNPRDAIKYALICKKMGYDAGHIQKILKFCTGN